MTLPIRPTSLPLLPALLIGVVLPITLAVGVIGYLSVSWLEREAEARMREDIELIARSLQQPLNQAIRTGEPVLLQRSLRSAFSFGRIYGAHIYGRDGELLAGAGVGVQRFADERAEAFSVLDPQSEGYAALGDEPTHVYFMPLTTSGGRIAAILQLTRHPDELRDTLALIRTAGGIGLAGVALLLSLIVVAGHRRAIGSPLAALSSGMQRAAQGRLDHRVTPSGPQEIRQLSEGFNTMLERIDMATEEITQRRSRESELQADLQASRKLAAIGELSAGVAHQLGTPLGVLDGRAQKLLRQQELSPAVREALEGMRDEVTRISHTVRQLMDFARTRPLQRRPSDIGEIVDSAVHRARDDVASGNAQIDLNNALQGDQLLVDPPRIEEALSNLLRNAVQAAPSGRVRVSAQREGDEYHITVEDDGPGIPQTERARLFEPFHTTKPVGSGTGLGLAVAHGIARSHGGSLQLQEPGELGGARFCLRLPRTETETGS